MNELARVIASCRLDGWKAIARYLGRDRTTAMRWAATRGLPVHRLPGGKRGSVFAIGPELDAWMAGLEDDPDCDVIPATSKTRIDRRTLVAAGIGAVAAGAAGVAAILRRETKVPSELQPLLEQARLLRSQTTLETQNQAIGLAQEAVRLAPGHATAWGALGYARAEASRWRPEVESRRLREQATMDGQRALDLDPDNAKGELALATALPLLGTNDWLARANGLKRALDRDPGDPDVLIERAWILRFTGHCAEAVDMCQRVDPGHYTPPLYNIWIRALWSAGRIEEMDRKLETALSRYPSNKTLWLTRLEALIFSDRADQAARIARSGRDRPSVVTDKDAEEFAALAEIVQRNDPAQSDSFMHVQRGKAREGVRKAINAVRFASTAGLLDEAFALADAHFFGRGFAVGESLGNGLIVPLSQRHTNFLFEPPAAAMRADPRFTRLTEELGLERYWRQAGVPPDYRRAGSPRNS